MEGTFPLHLDANHAFQQTMQASLYEKEIIVFDLYFFRDTIFYIL